MAYIEYLRQFRIGQFTIFDTASAYVGILILSPLLSWLVSKIHLKIPTASWIWFTLPLSVIFHVIFHQPTPLIKILTNPDNIQFYIAIFIIFAATYMGSRKVKRTT